MEKINKWMSMMIIGAVVIVAILFLPFVSAYGFSLSLFDMMDMGASSGEMWLFLILVAGGSGLAAAGGWLKNKLFALAGSAAAVAGIAYLMFFGDAVEDMSMFGFGLWLAIIGSIANLVLAIYINKEQQ